MNTQAKNIVASLANQGTSILCGLILPRAILLHYGSEMNGLAHSAARFLQFAVVMELGLGAVVPAAFYRPLAKRDYGQISAIMTSAYGTFRKIAGILTAYMILLLFLFPRFSGSAFPWETSTLLLVCSGIGTIAGYLAGKPEHFLLISDQKGYICYSLAIGSTLLSTAIGIVLIRLDAPLAAVKLAASAVSVAGIWLTCRYVYRRYPVSHRRPYTGEPIPQKWNGVAQHIAYVVLEYTDIIILTVFMTFREVSVYSVYSMVILAIRSFFTSATYSVQPKLGELWAIGDRNALNRFFRRFECAVHLSAVLLFSCTALLIVPFVRIYTDGVNDAQYVQPVFASLLTAACGMQCLRDPYDKLILATGHFKQTQKSSVTAACLNVGLSLLAVRRWGLPGVAVGTLAAMAYQTAYMSYYDSKRLLGRRFTQSLAQLLIDALTAGLILLAAGQIRLEAHDMWSWITQAGAVFLTAAAITAAVGFLCFRIMRRCSQRAAQ